MNISDSINNSIENVEKTIENSSECLIPDECIIPNISYNSYENSKSVEILENNTDKTLKKKENILNNNKKTNNDTNRNNTTNINKKLSILNSLKSLTNNINKTYVDFFIDENLQIHINDKIYNLININNLVINSSILLSEIYIHIMELYLKNNDFNISIIYKKNDILDSENLNICFFGSIPILDENSNKIVFYRDYQSVNRYIMSLNKNINQDILDNYDKLEKFCELKKKTHQMSNKHYLCMNKYFQIPSILLTSGSGIVSFLASSSYFEEQNLIFTISVGVASAVNTLFQSFSNAFEFSTKAESHQNATESYDQLLTTIRFEKMNPSIKPQIFIDNIEKQILDTKQRCKYMIPDAIEELYNENTFNSYKDNIIRDLLKKFISLKTELYYNSIKDTDDYSIINFNNIENDLGLDAIKDNETRCDQRDNTDCFCCFKKK